MKLKELEQNLQQVNDFEKPKIQLEQYITTPHLASRILFEIDQTFDDIDQKRLCDLGVGTGMLSIGCSMLGADYVLGVDMDSDALEICKSNLNQFEIENVDLIRADCKELLLSYEDKKRLEMFDAFDTVVMNPPFGTRSQRLQNDDLPKTSLVNNLGIDMQFLKLASLFATGAIYSLNKSVTTNYIRTLSKSWNLSMQKLNSLKYNIPKVDSRNRSMASSHQQKDIEVDLLRFTFN
jgi:predicted RNA methylase